MWLISIFVAALLGWSAILWLVLPLDIFRYSLTSIVAMHIAVPAGIISLWALARRGYETIRQKKAAVAEASQRDIRNAEKARQKHLFDEALRARRVGMDCRWAINADLIFHNDGKPLTDDTEQTATRFYTAPSSAIESWPQEALIELLNELFIAMPGAITLPIGVCGPADQSGAERQSMIRQVRQAVLSKQEDDFSKLASPDIISLQDDSRGVYAALHDVFMRRRDWPAMVVIAFDNCIPDLKDDFDNAGLFAGTTNDGTLSESEKWRGKAGRAISLLVLSQQELVDVLPKLDELGEGASVDSLTPYWEREKIPAGMAGHLMKWPKAWRENFASMQPIARFHRASDAEFSDKEKITSRAEKIQSAIVDAAINASLKDLDFVFEDESELAGTPVGDRITENGWLFHNAGDISCSGDRVATMSLALWQAGIELDPVSQATNTVMAIGDCGVATCYASLALAVQRVAAEGKPVVNIECVNSELSVSFVMPFRTLDK